ncbi:cation:proton antiporter [Myxococcota bacterium]|nr:cation:proton antiporter [Myxococcota bacterium]
MDAAMVLAAAGILLALYRLVKGPAAGSRAVALDVLTLITLPLIAYLAVRTGRGIYLDVALVYAILSFLGVMSLARYVEKGL